MLNLRFYFYTEGDVTKVVCRLNDVNDDRYVRLTEDEESYYKTHSKASIEEIKNLGPIVIDYDNCNDGEYYYIQVNNGGKKIVNMSFPLNMRIYGFREGLNFYYVPFTREQMAFYIENPSATVYEVEKCALTQPYVPTLEDVKMNKLRDIEMYDTSDSVNGFYYAGIFMWLDKATRVGLVNLIDSAELMGQETVQIWYGEYNLTLTISEARVFLAALEVYAAECFNVTESHKVHVNALTTIEEVESYDITSGYPEQLRFTPNQNQ